MNKLIDTHCHLDYLKDEELTSVLTSLDAAGVGAVVTIGVSRDNQSSIAQIAQRDARIYFTQGLHPHHASEFSPTFLDDIAARTAHPKCVAIGEIGLDYHYMQSPKEDQHRAFTAQMQFAFDHQLPVCIHTREAEDDTIMILDQFLPAMAGRILIHSFTGTPKLANWAAQRDCLMSVNGIITFKNAKNITDIIRDFPLERLVIETDAPYLAPVPHRGKPNTSLYLKHVAEFLAQLKNVNLEELKATLFQNTKRLFGKMP